MSSAFFAVLAVMAGLVSCGPSGKPEHRADLVFINGAEVTALDPVAVSDQVSGRVITSLFEGLMRYNRQGRAEPGCSLAPEISPDKKIYTFRLRPDAVWVKNGAVVAPVTAEDFAHSWRRMLEPANAAEYANIFYCIAGAEAYSMGKTTDFSTVGIRVLEPKTLQVTLANPTPYFLDLVAFTSFCPVTVTGGPEKHRLHFKPGEIVTNGAFQLGDWRLNDHIRLTKNPHYWDAASVPLNTVDVLPVSNASTALNLFLSGDVDLMLDKGLIPPNLGDKLRQQPFFHSKEFLATWFLRYNATRKPFNDARVRRAFTLALDKERIVTKITQYGEPVAYSLVPPGAGENYQPPPGLKQDITEARRLLAEAGYPDGAGFPTVGYLFQNSNLESNIAGEVQAMWKRNLNVNVSLPKQEYKVFLNSQKNLDYDLCRSTWIGDYNDPNTFLDMFTTHSGNNRTGWASAEYDRLIAAAASEPDTVRRHDIFRQAETLLLDKDCVITPVYHMVAPQFFREDQLGGVEANLTDEHPLRLIFRRR